MKILHSVIRSFGHSDVSQSVIRSFGHSVIRRSRQGSALLIVLGMVAFMVVSAIGFSVYMRESRKPSSFLRRESTARYLLKSALANAIARIDGEVTRNAPYNAERLEGVYDDVYPGLTRNNLAIQQNGNYWSHRVFMPFGPVGSQETVSTLTLEGLAYLPPAIINEARAFSRLTRTARWSNLSYDLGRYAFTAIDVSDCFDVNKLLAGERRSSAAGSRVNLSSLFPQNGAALDNLLTKWENGDGVPFVSLADFNVAAGNTPFTPFYKYIGSSGAKIYTSSDHQSVSNALFITDTWFPATNDYLTADLERKSKAATGTEFDLEKGGAENQPFTTFSTKNFLDLEQGGTFNLMMRRNLGGVGLACLYDYLDRDSAPISLALPTTEVAPMVCGLSLVGAANGLSPWFEEVPEGEPIQYVIKDSKGVDRTIVRTITRWQFRGIKDPNKVRIAGLVAYPFKRIKTAGRASKSFKAEPLVAVFYAADDLRCRLSNEDFRPTKDVLNDPALFTMNTGVCWYRGTQTAITLPSGDIKRTEEAIIPFQTRIDPPTGDIKLPVCFKVNEQEPTPPAVDPSKLGELLRPLRDNKLTCDSLKGNNARFRTFDKNGRENAINANNYNPKLFGATELQNPAVDQKFDNMPAGEYRLYCAVWVRITDDQNNTVDMVPATFADDQNFLKGCAYPGNVVQNAHISALCGDGVPLMDCKASADFNLKYDDAALKALDGSREVVFDGWKAFYAPDPRYNWAPEDWYGTMDDDVTKAKWLNAVTPLLGQNIQGQSNRVRDRDIFMFVSDQEYLQAIGELQFLPFVQRLGNNAEFLDHDFSNAGGYHGDNNFGSRNAGNPDGFANGDRFWRTYSAIREKVPDDENPYFGLRYNGKAVSVISGTGDFRVNPFSRDSRIVTAAVADTPYDYYVASTNTSVANSCADMSLARARQLAFGENGKVERWDAQDVEDIAAEIRDAFGYAYENDGVTDFAEVLGDYLNWETNGEKGDDQLNFLAENLDLADPLHGVDRKFLFSYWRECFQNRQQLFLVFIRAEPLTVGGSSGDAIANAQLGARGVALVWRDPAPPQDGGQRKNRTALSNRSTWREQCKQTGPHRTRVLFYHQFE